MLIFHPFTSRQTRLAIAGLLASTAFSGIAQAQQAPADAAPAGAAPAQATQPTDAPAPAADSEIIVTGSRVVRNGYSAPTPLTVMSIDQITKSAPNNIADYMNQLPQVQPSTTPRTTAGSTSSGTAGLNTLDLRGLGSNRTLVLLDGRRVVPSTQTGAVDINNLPSALVQRVEIVTGGASAAYGSDAVAGVVNFVLDGKFTGLKASVQSGITDRGDNRSVQAQAAIGASFAGGRGHVLLSGEYAHEEGIDALNRDWYTATYLINNPAYAAGNGQPRRIVASGVNYSTLAQGGLLNYGIGPTGAKINSVGGIQFGQNGTPYPVVYGAISGNFMVGGNTWNEGNVIAIAPALTRGSLWGRGSYEFSDLATLTVEGSYGSSRSVNSAGYQRYQGNLTLSATNPFLPQSVRNSLAAAGATQFNYGYSTYDLGRPVNDISRETWRVVASLDGSLGGSFRYNAYYQHGETDLDIVLRNTTNNANFNRAIDAVVNPATGQIVCRSSLASPGNGCVPLNIFGIGVASPDAIAYVKGTAYQRQNLTQDVAALSFTGEPVTLWAGPVSVAFGAEHRREAVKAAGDPISAVNGFQTGNFKSNAGSYTVTEGFGEVVVPLAKDMPFLKLLELNAASRVTSYSTAGTVVTWKGGLNYSPVEGLRLRVVRSRDIRAPNLNDLYVAGATTAADVNDPANGGVLTRITRVSNGNLDLKPEKADTFSVGGVFNPSFLRQLGLSVDYYAIKVNGAITTLTNQQIVDRCFAGISELCQYVVRDTSGAISQVIAVPVNVASVKERGLDVDLSFRQPLDAIFPDLPGTVSLRFLATKVFTYVTENNGIKDESVGENGGPNATVSIPKLRTYTTLSYEDARFSLSGILRTISSGVYDNTWVSGVDIDNNRIAGATYVDLAASYKIPAGGQNYVELFFKVDNLLDKDPPIAAGNGGSSLQTNSVLYDTLGRSYRGGFRFRF